MVISETLYSSIKSCLRNLMDEDERDEIKGAIDDLGSTTDEVIHMLEYYLENADPDNDYLRLSFF